MHVHGNPTKFATVTALSVDQVRVTKFMTDATTIAVKLSICLDGLGSMDAQVARGVIYRASDRKLMAVSEPVSVVAGTPLAWVDFVFPEPVELEQLTEYEYGIHGGGVGANIQLRTQSGGVGATVADTYADGTADPRPAGGANTTLISGFVTYFVPWVPAGLTDLQLARLPFPETQRIFGEATGPSVLAPQDRTFLTDCGWHGTITDPERGAVALVRSDSPLDDLVGERLRVRNPENGEVVYVICTSRHPDIPNDITLSRRAFLAIGDPCVDEIDADVEVLGL